MCDASTTPVTVFNFILEKLFHFFLYHSHNRASIEGRNGGGLFMGSAQSYTRGSSIYGNKEKQSNFVKF